MITLVLGGTRSGKSEVATRLATRAAGDRPVIYVATGILRDGDDEFAARVARHQAARPPTWPTVEAGAQLLTALAAIEPDAVVLVDSIGTWLAAHDDLEVDAAGLVAALRARRGATVVVSDEVGMGVHPSSELGRRFRDALGTLNHAVADAADDVLLVVAGRVLPLARP
jgi:adenosyl cobinamide kinase/adenosyl cobinamide phosphate guanylyltransferase